MRGNIATTAGERIPVGPVQRFAQRLCETRKAVVEAVEDVTILQQQLHDLRQVVAGPEPLDIGLGRANRAAKRDRAVKARIEHADGRLTIVVNGAEFVADAIVEQRQAAFAQGSELREHEAPAEPVEQADRSGPF